MHTRDSLAIEAAPTVWARRRGCPCDRDRFAASSTRPPTRSAKWSPVARWSRRHPADRHERRRAPTGERGEQIDELLVLHAGVDKLTPRLARVRAALVDERDQVTGAPARAEPSTIDRNLDRDRRAARSGRIAGSRTAPVSSGRAT
jgi:hypothetical protein